MASPREKRPEEVADKVLKRVEVSKIARKLQNRLALAQFKANRGWEDLNLDTIEPRFEEELRRKRPQSSDDIFSDSSASSTTSEIPYTHSRNLMSSPLKASLFSDQCGSGASDSGHRKRTYNSALEIPGMSSSSRKRFCPSPTTSRSTSTKPSPWKNNHSMAQSSPIKPRKYPNFTTSSGPNLSFFRRSSVIDDDLLNTNFEAISDDEDIALPSHSFNIQSAEPRTPPPVRNRVSLDRRNGKSGEEGADLLLFLATSPSPANPRSRAQMRPPSTPPPKKDMGLPSSMMTTPRRDGEGFLSVFGGPQTPSQNFDFSDFVNITPSWKSPRVETPVTLTRRQLSFDNLLSTTSGSPIVRDSTKSGGLGMRLGGNLLS